MKSKFGYYLAIVLIVAITISLILKKNGEEPKTNCADCNIILISFEALRSDHLGIYGYQRSTSPNIDKFFKNGIVFENAFSQAPNTLPTHMSIFTGLYPSHHKLISFVRDKFPLSNDTRTIAEILKMYGYKTEALYNGDDHIDPLFGFSRGFDHYKINDFIADKSVLFDFLGNNRNQKFFLFLYSSYSHDPYVAPKSFDTMFDSNYTGKIIGNDDEFNSLMLKNNITQNDFDQIRQLYWNLVNESDPRDIEHLIALYDSDIYLEDRFIGNLVKYLDSTGLLNRTIIIFTSGVGEEFGEHGGFMHIKLYDETIHVPLLIYIPNSKPEVINNQVRSVDILPTILSFVNITQPQNIDGRDLRFLIDNPNAADPNQILISEFIFQKAVRTPEWKLIKTVNQTNQIISYEFFNLISDPHETSNLDGNMTYAIMETKFKNILSDFETNANSTYIDIKSINSTFLGYP